MSGLSPTIVEHNIDTWLYAHPAAKNNANFILLRQQQLIKKLISFTKMDLSTQFLTHLGFPPYTHHVKT